MAFTILPKYSPILTTAYFCGTFIYLFLCVSAVMAVLKTLLAIIIEKISVDTYIKEIRSNENSSLLAIPIIIFLSTLRNNN